MVIKTYIKATLLLALISMSLGALLLHLRIHPLSANGSYYVPFVSGIMSLTVVPLLFLFRNTVGYGYVLNGMLVIVGSVTMGHLALARWPDPATLGTVLLGTTLPDILILWGKFFIGKALFDLEFQGYDPDRIKKGVTYRYPNYGWWLVHLLAISLVYALGNLLWR